MPQIIVCEWRIIFSERLLHKIGYPIKDPWSGCAILFPTPMPNTLHQDIWYWKALQIERKQDYKIEYVV